MIDVLNKYFEDEEWFLFSFDWIFKSRLEKPRILDRIGFGWFWINIINRNREKPMIQFQSQVSNGRMDSRPNF